MFSQSIQFHLSAALTYCTSQNATCLHIISILVGQTKPDGARSSDMGYDRTRRRTFSLLCGNNECYWNSFGYLLDLPLPLHGPFAVSRDPTWKQVGAENYGPGLTLMVSCKNEVVKVSKVRAKTHKYTCAFHGRIHLAYDQQEALFSTRRIVTRY